MDASNTSSSRLLRKSELNTSCYLVYNLVHNYMITALDLKTVAQFTKPLKVIIEYVAAQRVGSIFLKAFQIVLQTKFLCWFKARITRGGTSISGNESLVSLCSK